MRSVACPHCARCYSVRQQAWEQQFKCRNCGRVFRVAGGDRPLTPLESPAPKPVVQAFGPTTAPARSLERTMTRLAVRILAAVGTLVVIGLLARRETDPRDMWPPKTVLEPILAIDAATLFEHYQANEVAADINYKGRMLDVSGVVQSIGKDLLGTIYVTLEGYRSRIFKVQCFFDDRHEREAARLGYLVSASSAIGRNHR
jgi:hypothetical protein